MTLFKDLKSSKIHHLFFLYCLANIFFLLNYDGIYWDDWVLTKQTAETLKNLYYQTGFWWMGYLHIFLQKIGNGIYIYRLITFFSYFFSGWFLFYILQRINIFNKNIVFYIVLLFLLSPVNDARIALINTPAIFTVFFFYFAFFLLAVFLDSNKKLYNRIFILALFFITFSLESLLVFYSIVLCYIFIDLYQKTPDKKINTLITYFFTRYFDFICLPIVFFVLKHTLSKPTGLYAGYNSFGLDPFNLLGLIIKSFDTSFYQPIAQAFKNIAEHWKVALLILIMVVFIIRKVPVSLLQLKTSHKKYTEKFPEISFSTLAIMLITGILLFIIAVFPYCAVGKLPELDHWASRNQILIPLGMACLVYSLIILSTVIHKKLPFILLSIFISSFIIQTLLNYYRYDIDWFYQASLIEQFKQSKVIKENTTFIAKDNLEMNIWVHKRGVDFYEINGLFKKAFNEDTRLYVHDISLIKKYQQYKAHPQYNFSHWINNKPIYIELSANDDYSITKTRAFWLFYNNIFNKREFENGVRNLTKITYLDNPN